ncbi:MAG: hypothetical protein HYS87_02115 [Candidatus Colwellbacteria bacterium]|nr:hypothetical protein [Candidatus Colwellbacteria bacterium]
MRKILFVLLFITLLLGFSVNTAQAATNIDSTDRWAWNDVIGWIDFHTLQTVIIRSTPSSVSGAAALLSAGDSPIYLRCLELFPLGCQNSQAGDWSVFWDNIEGLSGWAWSETVGWISFDCQTFGDCASSDYRVLINKDTGEFSGFAWSLAVGWISFNCIDIGVCGVSDYKVIANLGAAPGEKITNFTEVVPVGSNISVAFNSIVWEGMENGGSVKAQVAVSDSEDGPWNDYRGPLGYGDNSVYELGFSGTITRLKPESHPRGKYYRLKIIKVASTLGEYPTVDAVYVNWSY